ncbi:DUF397 domain-containing protein [Streptomyces sp. WAC 00631]|uniref:DUF397 domain-containing protein n=1 Tax=Streptomyces sp. WAC 00631 TaxID=2203201 RepID=UPI000F773D64|nr:DUF397 domain-containing protein [Streptomyces sp. WAC 00631]MCC5032866.1 DUF397 domain-containing protein [Streptomyces sp. WAC 00631]
MTLKSTAGDGSAPQWTKSSYSSNDGPDCVEVAAIPGTILVRDSKNVQGPQLGFEPGAWARFLSYTAER